MSNPATEPYYGHEDDGEGDLFTEDEIKQFHVDKHNDYLSTFVDHPAGKRVLAHLVSFCFQNRPTFEPNNARVTDFREGRRSVMLDILNQIELDDHELTVLARQLAQRR